MHSESKVVQSLPCGIEVSGREVDVDVDVDVDSTSSPGRCSCAWKEGRNWRRDVLTVLRTKGPTSSHGLICLPRTHDATRHYYKVT